MSQELLLALITTAVIITGATLYLNNYNLGDIKTHGFLKSQQTQELKLANGGRWYKINPVTAFNAGFNYGDYNNGACNGFWKDAKFMQAPYITKDSNSITASNTGEAVRRNACIY